MLPIITNLEATRGVEPKVIKMVLMDDGRLRMLTQEEWQLRGSLEGPAGRTRRSTNDRSSRRPPHKSSRRATNRGSCATDLPNHDYFRAPEM